MFNRSTESLSAATADVERDHRAALQWVMAMVLVALSVWWLSDVLVRQSLSFWRWTDQHATTFDSRPLLLESALAQAPKDGESLFFLGSSVVKHNVERDILSEALGTSREHIVRLDLPGATAAEVSMLLPRVVDARPRTAVYLATPAVLLDEMEWSEARIYHLPTALKLLGLWSVLSVHEDHASGWLQSKHVIFRNRRWLRGISFDVYRAPSMSTARREQRRKMARRELITAESYRCDNFQLKALTLLASGLGERGIDFHVFATPMRTLTGRNATRRALMDECLTSSLEAQGAVYHPYSSLPSFSKREFSTASHLRRGGAIRFSRHMAKGLH